jgi:peptidoglycan/LPS O-acetylase OafA/YrhL
MDSATSIRPQGRPAASSRGEIYWPEIDGLRTIAVVSVLAFHLSPRLFNGGFVGVDIFFVISGFLITTLLIESFENGDSIIFFYQRRIARIAPASFLVVAITMIAASLLYSDQDFASVGATATSAALSFINIKLLFQGAYFKLSPDAQPLIHYWSLALEEQFYFVFPVFLYFLMSTKRHLLNRMLAVCAIGYVACVVLTPFVPVAAFYLLPTRGWELLAGSTLAIAKKQNDSQLPFGVPIGLVVLALSFLIVQGAGFPGWIAILPVAGSTAILAGIASHRRTTYGFLAHPFMVFVGKRSYSLYLWHWPTFSFVDYYFYSSNLLLRLSLKVLITTSGALLSYCFVETPMRKWLNVRGRCAVAFGAFALTATLLSVVGYHIRSTYYLTAEPSNVAAGGIVVNPAGRGSIVLMGDSQGAMYGHELASLARELNFRLNVVSVAASNELPGEPETLWSNVLRFLDVDKPDAIILAQAWSSKLGEGSEAGLEKALSILADRTRYIFVLTQPPFPPPNATREAIRDGSRPPFFESRLDTENRFRANMIIQKLTNDRIRAVDAAPYFLKEDHSIKMVASNGRLTFHDESHLTDSGTALVRPALELLLRKALNLPLSPN